MKVLMSETDATEILVRRAREGDQAAFNALIERFQARLESVIASRLGSHLRGRVQADDLRQEVLIWAFKSIDRFQWQGDESFFRWLKGISEHVILKAANREKKRFVLPLVSDVAVDQGSPSKLVRREERFNRFQVALDRLSPDHREVILLARIERLAFEEIARRMDRSPDAVKQLLRRALKELKAVFGDTESLHLPHRAFEPGGQSDA